MLIVSFVLVNLIETSYVAFSLKTANQLTIFTVSLGKNAELILVQTLERSLSSRIREVIKF